jgi:DcuC family C4-dicarboxylate transporter
MLELCLAAAVTTGVGYVLVKRYKPQGVLIVAGILLMAAAIVLGKGPLVPAKQSTGFLWFDIFAVMKIEFAGTLPFLGLTIMTIGGFVRYMEKCGANEALVELAMRPLKYVRSPLLILMLCYFISQIVTLFVPSHAGIGLLLMLTMYPVLIRTGSSVLTALAIIATSKFTDLGPISSNAVLAAHTAGMDPTIYFVKYQAFVGVPAILAVGIAHYFVQPWWDKREKGTSAEAKSLAKDPDRAMPPAIYAILPTLPLVLVIAFSPLVGSRIKMDAIVAVLICTTITMAFELVRLRDTRAVTDNLMVFFDGMGKQFTIVVSLIVASQIFGMGLMRIGAVDTLITKAQSAGLGLTAMVVAISAIMIACSFVMGSGNASFFSFASLAPRIAAYLNVAPVIILLPMEITSGFGRCMSPITPAIVAIAGIAGASPIQVAKRCVIPVLAAIVANMIATYYFFLSNPGLAKW